jgi:hypothetical protein
MTTKATELFMPRNRWRILWLIVAIFFLPTFFLAGRCLWGNEPLVVADKTADEPLPKVAGDHTSPGQVGSSVIIKTVFSRGPSYAKAVFALGCCALYYAVYVLVTLLVMQPTDTERVVHLVIWTLAPPAYFFAEWFFFYPRYGDMRPEVIDSLVHGQDICRDLWAAFVALFGALHIAESLKNRPADASDTTP